MLVFIFEDNREGVLEKDYILYLEIISREYCQIDIFVIEILL